MSSATITYGAFVLSNRGRAHFGVDTEYVGERGVPKARRRRFDVALVLDQLTFAGNELAIGQLATALGTQDQVLLITDELGKTLYSERVRVASHNVPRQWRQTVAEVEISFVGLEEPLTASATDAVFTPTGGVAVTLPGLTALNTSARTDRYSNIIDAQREVVESFSASGTWRPDVSLDAAARRTQLFAAEATIRALANTVNGSLAYAGATWDRLRVSSADADAGDGSESLTWSLSFERRAFPGETRAEIALTVRAEEDRLTGKRLFVVEGEVKAATLALALAREADLLSFYSTAGRLLLRTSGDDTIADGATAGDVTVGNGGWYGRRFRFEFRELLADLTACEYSVDTQQDLAQGVNRVTYSGTCVAPDAATALAAAQAIGLNKLPGIERSQERVSYVQVTAGGNATAQFVQVDFTYEYVGKGLYRYAQVRYAYQRDKFSGPHLLEISGFMSCPTEAESLAAAQALVPPGSLQRGREESTSVTRVNTGPGWEQTFQRVDFRYSLYLAYTEVTCAYDVEVVNSESGSTTSYTGTCWGADEGVRLGVITGLTSYGGVLKEFRYKVRRESQPGGTFAVSTDFSRTYAGGPNKGANLMLSVSEAESTLSVTGSVALAVFTPIPYGEAYVQPNVGYTVGVKQVAASARGKDAGACKAWVQGTKGLIAGGYQDPPLEETQEIHDYQNDKPVEYRVNGRYSAKFAYLPI